MTLMGEWINAGFCVGKSEEIRVPRNPGIDGKIILKWVLGK